MRISVIIPTYNRARLVQETIASLLSQTRKPDEIIVLDYGSTDYTPAILQQYSEPVRVFSQSNQGRSNARNRGLQAAEGDLITFLDSDDTLPPTSIEKREAYLVSHPEMHAVYCDVAYQNDDQELGRFSAIRPGPRPSGTIFAELARHNMVGPPAAVLFRAACTHAFRPEHEPVEDYDLWLRMATQCAFGYLGEPLVTYRVHADMSTLSESQAMQEAIMRIHNQTVQRPAFTALSPKQKARILCSHGILFAEYGHMEPARHRFRTAIETAPFYPGGSLLFAAGLLGRSLFLRMIRARRSLRGDVSWAS
ncbi:MAG: glycosyltransferase family 2 protein [Anaerolineae bacterium]